MKQVELLCVGSIPAPGWSWSCPLHSRWENVSPAGGPSPQWCVCTPWGPQCSPPSELSPASYWLQPTPWWPGGLQNLEEQREKSSITQILFFLFQSICILSKSCAVIYCCAAVLRIQIAVWKSCEGILAAVSNMSEKLLISFLLHLLTNQWYSAEMFIAELPAAMLHFMISFD